VGKVFDKRTLRSFRKKKRRFVDRVSCWGHGRRSKAVVNGEGRLNRKYGSLLGWRGEKSVYVVLGIKGWAEDYVMVSVWEEKQGGRWWIVSGWAKKDVADIMDVVEKRCLHGC
jgi:hypothetical protein